MRISFYKEGLGWHARSELKGMESVCIEFGGKKVYVFNNKQTHTVGVNIFDFSKGDQKILSYNEPQVFDGVEEMDDEFVDLAYVDPFAVTAEAVQAGRKSLQHGRQILEEIKGEGFSMVPSNTFEVVNQVQPQPQDDKARLMDFLKQLGIPIIEIPMTKEQFVSSLNQKEQAQVRTENAEQKDAARQRFDQRG